jgi:hypothetical protein
MKLTSPSTAGFTACFTALILTCGISQAADTPAPDELTFASPALAVDALTNALKADDEPALIRIFGERNKDLIVTSDKTATQESRQRTLAALQEATLLRTNSDKSITLIIGKNAWPIPIPLVQDGANWRFDSDKGADEIINRRIGANELTTIEILHAYPQAQRVYALEPHDHSEVRSFARHIISTPGKQDGLFWETATAEEGDISPFGPLIAEEGSPTSGEPYHGYYFKILTGQGAQAPGGKYSYIINGHMLAGFAMLAWPADYGSTGVKSFIVNHYGIIYEKDLGKDTTKSAHAIRLYNPDHSWSKVSD